MRIDLLAVDLDGTLVDSAPDLAHCLREALAAVRLPPPGEARTRAWIGDGIEVLLARALQSGAARSGHAADAPAGERYEVALAAFTACYGDNLFVRSALYPGAAETLDALSARGIRLCCVTNKRAAFTEEILRCAGLRQRFELVVAGDSVAEKKPSPLPLECAARSVGVSAERAALVGDSHHDYHAARAAGFRFVWAAYGYCPTIDPGPDGPIPTIRRFPELLEIVQGPAA